MKKTGRALMVMIVGIFCTLILVAVFGVLYLNRASDSVLPILVKVSAAVLAAVALLVIDLSKAPDTLHSKIQFLVFRNESGELLYLAPATTAVNLPQSHAYQLIDQLWVVGGYTPRLKSFEIDDVFDELLGATFLKWMALRYHLHWEMGLEYVTGISGGVGHGWQREGRDSETATYLFADSANGFLVHDRPFNEIQLPKGSEASLRTTSVESVFTIRNRHMTFTFKARRLGNSGISHSILGDKIDAHLKHPGSFYSQDYVITLDAEFLRLRRWSPQTGKQKDWMKQVFDDFERDFSWDTFKPQLEKAIDGIPEDKLLVGVPVQLRAAQK